MDRLLPHLRRQHPAVLQPVTLLTVHRVAVTVGEAVEDRIEVDITSCTNRTLATATASSLHTTLRTRRPMAAPLLHSPATHNNRSNSGIPSMDNTTHRKPCRTPLCPHRITIPITPLRCTSNNRLIAANHLTRHSRHTVRATRPLPRNLGRQHSSGADIRNLLRTKGPMVEVDEVVVVATMTEADQRVN